MLHIAPMELIEEINFDIFFYPHNTTWGKKLKKVLSKGGKNNKVG